MRWNDEAVIENPPGGDGTRDDDFGDTDGAYVQEVTIVVINLNLTASDLFGTVQDDDEVTTGAFVHFNLDNDNGSVNTLNAPKHPGSDYGETTDPIAGESDLCSLVMALPPLQEGTVTLKVGAKAKIWKSATKGNSNLVLASGEESWDLADATQRNEISSLASSLWIEGMDVGESQVEL